MQQVAVKKHEESKSDDTSPKQYLKGTTGSVFVKENVGNIKDYYKISSIIGKGKSARINTSNQLGAFAICECNVTPLPLASISQFNLF